MSIVSARNLSKAYGPHTLFSQIALTISNGEHVGLLGANGAGKSTLLRVLAGKETADEGTIDRRRDARILYLSQEPALDESATPRQLVEQGLSDWHRAKLRHQTITAELEAGSTHASLLSEQAKVAELIEQLGGWTRDHVALQMLEHLGVRDIDRTVATMSGGERRRVALAQLLVAEPELAILDEPTNHLDTDTIEWLETYLAEKFAGAVLMVTHDRYVLDAVADRILELEAGAILEFEGGYADYLERKAELEEHAGRVEKNRLNLLRRERAWLMRGARARSTKQKAHLERAKATVATRARQDAPQANFAGLEQGAGRTGKTILDLEEMSFEIGGKKLIDSLTLRLVGGDRIGIIGPNGAGKTSLLKIVVRGLNTRFVYFDQTRSQLNDAWSVIDNVAEREGAERNGGGLVLMGERPLEMNAYLEQFLFDRSKQRQKVASLSGGERARVALAKALKTGANLLLLDEPTNDLDIATLAALEELLESWPGCAMIVSHDRYFLDRVATSILAFEGNGKVTRYPGGYETYRSLRRPPEAIPIEPPTVRSAQVERTTGPKPLTFAERKELAAILDEISRLEVSTKELENQLADPALYVRGPEEAGRLRADHARAELALAERTARWEELEARRDVKRS